MRAMLSFTAWGGSFMPSAARPAGADIASARPTAVVKAEVANSRRFILILSVARLKETDSRRFDADRGRLRASIKNSQLTPCLIRVYLIGHETPDPFTLT